jgi:hypothetical protein
MKPSPRLLLLFALFILLVGALYLVKNSLLPKPELTTNLQQDLTKPVTPKTPQNLSDEVDAAISNESDASVSEDLQTEKILNDATSETEKSFMRTNEEALL